jgi:hypothetical protein
MKQFFLIHLQGEDKRKRQSEVFLEELKNQDDKIYLLYIEKNNNILSVDQLIKKRFEFFIKKRTLYLKDN